MSTRYRRTLKLLAAAMLFAGLGGAAGYWLATHHAKAPSPGESSPAKAADRKVLYWYDPMKPDQHFDKPGQSPFMSMPLLAKYADAGNTTASVRIDPGMAQNLGIRLARVERGTLATSVEAVGSVQWNARQVAIVQMRSAGFVERVYARAPGDVVAKNAPLADVLVPEWAGTQTEFLAMLGTGDAALAKAARERLQLLGMPAELIAQVESSRRPSPVVTITAPIAGEIEALDVRAGMSLGAGMTVARINGLDPVWIEAAVPEAQIAGIRIGDAVRASLAAYPGQHLTGKVIAVLPEVNPESRTLRVRIELPNHDGRLKAGMFAQIDLTKPVGTPALQVPSEAVIRTGRRNVVLLALDGGRFQPVEVRLGGEANGRIEVLDGLSEGQEVVASGQFLIDSEASLKEVLTRLTGTASGRPTSPAASANALNEADGVVQSISGREIVLSHGPVQSLGWSAMTMPFQLAHPQMAATLKPGDRVHFGFRQADEGNVIEQLDKSGGQP